jgi:predicted transcriptional regulator
MSRLVRKTFSLPDELSHDLEQAAMAHCMSESAVASQWLRDYLSVQQQLAESQAKLAQVRAHAAALEAELATRPPPDFRDSILKETPGTAKLVDERDAVRAEVGRLKRLLATARQEVRALRDRCAALQTESNEARHSLKLLKATSAEQQADLAKAQGDLTRTKWKLADEKAKRIPVWCRFQLPLPILTLTLLRLPTPVPWRKDESWRMGVARTAYHVWLPCIALLWLVPWDTALMRLIAVEAMGTRGDVPAAAARLHGGPLMGADDLNQLYVLTRARDNPKRLTHCFEAAEQQRQKGRRKAIPCTITIPSELELHLDFVTSGPHAATSRVKARQEAREAKARAWREAPR